MATETKNEAETQETQAGPPATEAGWKPYRLSVKQFKAMIDAGIFPDDAHVELLGGVLIRMTTRETRTTIPWIPSPRGFVVLSPKTGCSARRSRSSSGRIRGPSPISPWSGVPGPSSSRGPPHAKETAFVVEVAESSYAYDRGVKWRAYAAARIPIYWIVNLPGRRVEDYTDPAGRGKSASYRGLAGFAAEDEVPVVLDGQGLGRVSVRDILP